MSLKLAFNPIVAQFDLVQDVSGFVPYTGATTSVDLGSQTLTSTGYITGELAKVRTDAPSSQKGDLWLDTDEIDYGYVSLSQATPQTFVNGAVSGTGYLIVSGGTIGLQKKNKFNVRVVIGTTTATDSDDLIVCNSSSSMTVNLPAATGSGSVYHIKNVNTGIVTVDANSSETIDGETTQEVDQWTNIQIVDYASGLWVIV